MIKNNKKLLFENDIIDNYLKQLNFNKIESYNFKNDGAFLKKKKDREIIVTNDTITETIDFFKNDDPESIAQKIITYNLSDLSAMGASPYSYTLSLTLPKRIDSNWIKKFTKKLLNLQNKYKIFLIGGDIGKSKLLSISSCFFGYAKKKSIIKRNTTKLGDSIWVSGNIGESYIGLLIKKNKIKTNYKLANYFIKKYLYPEPCMLGFKVSFFTNSGIDISDGFIGDLSKLLNDKLGAELIFSKIPLSQNAKKLISLKKIDPFSILTGGDDYQLILTINDKNEDKLKKIAKQNNIKVTKVGRIIKKKGIFLDGKKIKISNVSFQYYF